MHVGANVLNVDHGWNSGYRIRPGLREQHSCSYGAGSVPRLVAEKQPLLGKFLTLKTETLRRLFRKR